MRKLNLCIFDDTPKNVDVSAFEKWGRVNGWLDGWIICRSRERC